MNKLFTYTVKIPEIFSRKEYDFIFIGYESVGRLVKRKDIPYTSEPISTTFSEPISEIVFLGHIHGKWDTHRIELKAKDYLEPETHHVHEQTPERLSLQNNFYISGELGDIIYSLPAIKKHGGGNLYIGGQFNEFPNYKILDKTTVNQLSKILVQQSYIHDVYFSETLPNNTINLNEFKRDYIKWNNGLLSTDEVNEVRCTDLVTKFYNLLNLSDNNNDEKWLDANNTTTNDIIINRSLKYHNDRFPWIEIVSNYGDYITFIGFENEYDDFCNKFGKVKYTKTDTLVDVYNIISKCNVFIGNQSFCYSLAEGLKKNIIQETCTWIPNCQFFRENSLIFKNGENCNFTAVVEFLKRFGYTKQYLENIVKIKTNCKQIFYIGQSGTSGYAKAAKGYIYDLYKQGHDVDWLPLKFDTSEESRSTVDLICKGLQVESTEKKYDEIYLHCTPDLWQPYKQTYNKTFKNTKVIGVSVWETEVLPTKWASYINQSVDILHVPSEFNKQIYIKNGVTVPIEVKPHIFHYEKLPSRNDIEITSVDGKVLDTSKFTFYNIGELHSRKGINEALTVFNNVFEHNNEVQFLLKLHYKDYNNENFTFILNELSEFITKPNIFVVSKKLTDNEILAFHSVGDCYFSLHKGEAFGLVLHEAFKYGKPVINTKYGGQIEFLPIDYPYFVKCKLQPVDGMSDFSCWYDNNQLWGVPDLKHAEQIIKKVYDERR